MSIDTGIRDRIDTAIVEMSNTHRERLHIIKGMYVALIAKQHLLMLGQGGTGKSFMVRDLASRIENTTYFETALDETSDPGQLFGPVDIKAMKDLGKYRRRTDGMLPEADIAFIDEFFNANGPTLHGMMPVLNERVFHNNGHPSICPLWSAFMGTNKLNADADQAATWDRVHHRWVVRYVADRNNLRDVLLDNVKRRISNWVEPAKSTITRDELVKAHDEAMQLEVPDAVLDTFLDIKEALLRDGIDVSTRRMNEGFAAVLANAWLNGHDPITTADLDVLQSMWWVLQDDADKARGLILSATNPGEKAALEFMDDLDKWQNDLRAATAKDLDETKLRLVGIEVYKNCNRVLDEAKQLEEKAAAAGSSTARIAELKNRTSALIAQVQSEYFNL